jgi:hypothetical protein
MGCHYFCSAEREIHIKDVQPCSNCSAPVCSTCRTDGLCLECQEIKNDTMALQMRQITISAHYNKCRKFGVE